MANIPGARPSKPIELTRAEDRISFLYLEHCTIGRDSNSLTATDDQGIMHIPSAALGVLMLGPGTRVTHQAMVVIADAGSTIVWVGENGVRYYAHGRPIGRSTRLLEQQAKLVSNRKTRLAVAREMYGMRFSGEDVESLNMQQLRGREGARVRSVYREWSKITGVEWSRREYRPDDFSDGTPINQALSAAHSCLYGVVHAVIVSLGMSPGLGFVHTGHDRAFVYDIADLYKADITIPIAFTVISELGTEVDTQTLSTTVRRRVRDRIREEKVISRCVKDLKLLMKEPLENEKFGEVIELWDYSRGTIKGGTNYSSGEPPW